MKIINQATSLIEIWELRETAFEELLKIVVDIDRNLLAVDAEMHADLEQMLLKEGSAQQNLWGANIYPLRSKKDQIEFTSLINIRPAIGNRSMEVTASRDQKKNQIYRIISSKIELLYPLKLHTHLNPEKWAAYSKTQQVLMISNELNRALNCLGSNHPLDAGKCYERAMELTDLTVEDQRWDNGLKELLRFRELLSELYLSNDIILARLTLSTLLLFNVDAHNMLH